jgi:nucleoside-diphosphate-sugar epimerase
MMNSVLVTGASGFVSQALLPLLVRRGHKVYALSRHPPQAKDLIPLAGDITQPDLGLEGVPKDIHAVYHLAGIHSLRGEDKDKSIWMTNVAGTQNVLDFCVHHDIPRLYFVSTAYAHNKGRNPYEKSKIINEEHVNRYRERQGLKTTIFKPSIIMGTAEHPYPGHFSQFVSLVVKIHRRAELIRRKIEGTLRLPILEPVFRIKGNPEGKLNLVTVDRVAEAMANIDKEGTFWLTNPAPPTLGQLVEWVGEFIMVDMRIEPEFKPTPIEAAFQKMAAAFEPYLWGDDFSSDLKECPITKEFIHETIKRSIL